MRTMVCHMPLLLSVLLLAGAVRCEVVETEETTPVKLTPRHRAVWRGGSAAERQVFQISAFGQVFLLHLRPDSSFVAPTLHIQHVRAKQVPPAMVDPHREDVSEELRGCFYSGKVNEDMDSVVALSLCQGIRGTFITRGDEYFIQPVQSGGTTSQPHIIRRRVVPTSRGTSKSEAGQVQDNKPLHAGEKADRTRREKRFVSSPRYIETLVVADYSMTRFYGDEIKVKVK